MVLIPALPPRIRALLLRALLLPVAAGAAFGGITWLLRGDDPVRSWFLPAAITLAVVSVLICSTLAEAAFGESGKSSARLGYHVLGPIIPALTVLLLGRVGVALGLALLALVLLLLPSAPEQPANEA